MTDNMPDPALSKPRSFWSPKNLKIALIISLGLNLIILGIVAGAMVHGMSDRGGPRFRELAFGPFTDALSDEDRQALRKAFMRDGGNPREMRREMRSEFGELLNALRAEPFDADQLRTIFASMQTRMRGRIDLGQKLLSDQIVAMTPEARLGFADRLDAIMKRGPKGKEPPPEE